MLALFRLTVDSYVYIAITIWPQVLATCTVCSVCTVCKCHTSDSFVCEVLIGVNYVICPGLAGLILHAVTHMHLCIVWMYVP